MARMNYPYSAPQPWPDAVVGENKYYSVSFEDWLANEGDSLVNIDWILPVGITSDDKFVNGGIGNIKLGH